MQKLIKGIHRFKSDVFAVRQDFFERLVRGQTPQALFITCSDSRMVPDLICQADPGDLFVIRNAGNIVPPYSPGVASGEAATIEYAIRGLGIKDIIVCGHTRCGAMQAVLSPDAVKEMPRVKQWLASAEASAEIVCNCYRHLSEDARWNVVTQENVLVQLEHLRTHPAVLTGLAAGELRLHAWVYKMETGEVFSYDPESGQFSIIDRGTADRSAPVSVPRAANHNGNGPFRALTATNGQVV
jgi:carbonic anhydrase